MRQELKQMESNINNGLGKAVNSLKRRHDEVQEDISSSKRAMVSNQVTTIAKLDASHDLLSQIVWLPP